MSSDERVSILREIDAGWRRHLALIDAIPQAELERANTVGTWSGRDVITHIANWEEYCAALVHTWDRSAEKRWSYDFDEAIPANWDRWNEEQVASFRVRQFADVRAYIDRVHAQLIETVSYSMTVTRDDLVGMTTGHYDAHAADLRSLVARTD
jgi:hypothetical protein